MPKVDLARTWWISRQDFRDHVHTLTHLILETRAEGSEIDTAKERREKSRRKHFVKKIVPKQPMDRHLRVGFLFESNFFELI